MRRDRAELEDSDYGDDDAIADASPSQRQCLDEDALAEEELYVTGSILHVKLRNFMTYAGPVSIKPGPRLNLIVGPNGSGKSSFVCAICLGLAGSTKLLGRAERVQDYIKTGEQYAELTITLKKAKPGETLVVYRKIKRDGQSEWKLNGASASQKKVEEKLKELSVQLDNLCQFLPQDRVVEFARMKPGELLEATEKATGNQELYEMHQTLKTEKKDISGLEKEVARSTAMLAQLETLNEGLQRDVKKIQERDAILAEVSIMKKKLPWLEYEAKKELFRETCEKYSQAKAEVEKVKAEEKESGEPVRKKQAAAEAADAALKGAKQKLKSMEDEIATDEKLPNNTRGRWENECDAIGTINDSMQNARDKEEKRKKKLREYETQIARAQSELDELKPPAKNETNNAELSAQIKALSGDLRGAEEEAREADGAVRLAAARVDAVTNNLNRLQDGRHIRVQMLAQKRPGMKEAVEWVEANKHVFQKPVFGPIGCEVAVIDSGHAGFLEQHVPGNLWSMFVTQVEADSDILRRELARYKIDVATYTGNADAPIQHPVPLAELARFGITHTLDQVFDAPAVVKHVLCDNAAIHKAYVGTRRTDQMISELFASTGVRTLWTPTNQYLTSVSRYDQSAKSTRVVAAKPARLFAYSDTRAERQRLMEDKDLETRSQTAAIEKRDGFNAQIKAINAQLNTLQKERSKGTSLVAEYQKRKVGYEKRILTLRNQLEAERKQGNLDQQLKKLAADSAKAQAHVLKLAAAANRTVIGMVDQLCDFFVPSALSVKELVEQQKALQAASNQFKAKVANAEALKKQIGDIKEAEKADLKKLKTLADKNPLSEEEQKKCEVMPDDPQELQNLIATKEREADAIVCSNPQAVVEYKKRCAEIAALKESLGTDSKALAERLSQIDKVKATWLPNLRKLFGKISIAFQDAFKIIGASGEVLLYEPEDGDFEKYEARIMVKFRDREELQVLTANRQSGGERSVSTMLYLIAMQDLTLCPFRVVDEINQGMDPKNERRIFQKMVSSSAKSGTPQCFLLTPKLLPQLDYGDCVTVLSIFNGPCIKEVACGWRPEMMLASLGSRMAGVA